MKTGTAVSIRFSEVLYWCSCLGRYICRYAMSFAGLWFQLTWLDRAAHDVEITPKRTKVLQVITCTLVC